MCQQELGTLKTLRQLYADRLLDHQRAGESDQGTGLRDIQVAEHGEAGRHTARSGVGKQRNVRDLRVVKLREHRGDLGQLHQADDALHHAGAARCGNDDQRLALGQGTVGGTGDHLSNHRAHRSPDEAELHDAEHHILFPDPAHGVDDGIIQAGLLARVDQALFVPGLEQHVDAELRRDLEVVAAVGANLKIGFKIGPEDHLAAFVALDPKPFRPHLMVRRGLDLVIFAFKPTHRPGSSARNPGTATIVAEGKRPSLTGAGPCSSPAAHTSHLVRVCALRRARPVVAHNASMGGAHHAAPDPKGPLPYRPDIDMNKARARVIADTAHVERKGRVA